jgi:hypothetical protein
MIAAVEIGKQSVRVSRHQVRGALERPVMDCSMIDLYPNKEDGWVEAKIHGKIEEDDFAKVGPVADEMIAEEGKLKGVVLNATEFTGWQNLHALLNHLKFEKARHRFIARVALVGNKRWQEDAPKLVSIFVDATVRFFPKAEMDAARAWVSQRTVLEADAI